MRRFVLLAFLAVSSALPIAWPVAAKMQEVVFVNGGPGQARDPSQPQPPPPPRPMPIGNATISGSVTTADTGRPVRDARVFLSGTATIIGADGQPTTTIPGMGARGASPNGAAPAGRGVGASMLISLSVSRTVFTDATGRFSIAKLPAGRFTLSVTRNQFLQVSFGQKRPGGPGASIALTDGQQMKADVRMMHGGVISGTVYGEDGDPLAGAQMRGWRYAFVNGVKRLQSSGFASTDDRGMYRMSNLQPGDYLIAATPNASEAQMAARLGSDPARVEEAIMSGTVQPPAAPGMPATVLIPPPPPRPDVMSMDDNAPLAYLPTYYPTTPARANASAIHVTGGDEHAGIDIPVQYVQAGSVEGTIAGALKPGVAVQVSLLSDDPAAEGPSNTRVDPNGKFTFRALAPGTYTVFAQTVAAPPTRTIVNGVVTPVAPGPPPRIDDADRLWGRATATIDGATAAQVSISLRPGRSISGIVVFDVAKPPDLTRARIMVTVGNAPGAQLMPQGMPPQAQVEPDGRFTLTGVVPSRYVLRLNGGGTLKTSMVDGEDTLDFPLNFVGDKDVTDAVLTVTDKLTELSGALTDPSGKPGVDYTVIAAAVDARFWTPGSRRIATSRSGVDGHYTFRALPPGDYYLAVVSDLESGVQYDPEFLKTLSGASTRVVVADGEKLVQDLRVGRLPAAARPEVRR